MLFLSFATENLESSCPNRARPLYSHSSRDPNSCLPSPSSRPKRDQNAREKERQRKRGAAEISPLRSDLRNPRRFLLIGDSISPQHPLKP